MTYRNDHFGDGHAVAGYANTPVRVPFVELVEPFMHVGEEVVRFGAATVAAMYRATGAFTRWRNERSTIKELMALDDRILEDIGVRRSEIMAVARKLAHG